MRVGKLTGEEDRRSYGAGLLPELIDEKGVVSKKRRGNSFYEWMDRSSNKYSVMFFWRTPLRLNGISASVDSTIF